MAWSTFHEWPILARVANVFGCHKHKTDTLSIQTRFFNCMFPNHTKRKAYHRLRLQMKLKAATKFVIYNHLKCVRIERFHSHAISISGLSSHSLCLFFSSFSIFSNLKTENQTLINFWNAIKTNARRPKNRGG